MTVRNVLWAASNIAALKEEWPAHYYIAVVLGPTWPSTWAVTHYSFDMTSTAVPDDVTVIKPNFSFFDNNGRWLKCDNSLAGLSSVATSGSYADLANKPTIPTINTQYRIRAQTNTSGVYTWTFPATFGTGITPVVEITVEDNSSASWNHQITAISPTSVTIQLVKTTAVTVLGVSVLGVASNPQAYVHLLATAP